MFGNVKYKVAFFKVEFPTALIYVVSEQIRKKPGGSNIRTSYP
jgi:hypothetical protein